MIIAGEAPEKALSQGNLRRLELCADLLEREPQFRANRSAIVNSLLTETEDVSAKVRIEVHGRDHGLT